MSENLSLKQKENIISLKRLCRLYMKFMTVQWSDVHIFIEGGYVYITWFQVLRLNNPDGTKNETPNTSFKKFPLKDLNKQIKSYRQKINIAFKNRHKPSEQ